MKTLGNILLAIYVLLAHALFGIEAQGATLRPFDVIAYDWTVALAFEKSPGPESPWRNLFSPTNELEAEARISLRNAGPSPLKEIPLLFNRLLVPTSIEVGGATQSFEQDLRGLEGNESLQINYVLVSLSQHLDPGAEIELAIRYRGQLMGYPESGMLYVRETLDPDFTILRSETYCYPHVASPSDEAASWAARHDAFDQTLRITLPRGYVAVNGGRSLGVDQQADRLTYSFASQEPDSAIQIAIAPYRTIAAGGHRIFHFALSEEGAQTLVVQLGRAMELLGSFFGPLPSERRLTIAEIPDHFGSQAGALILQTSGAFNDPDRHSELYHELSHLWNPPDVDDRPSRWNEGLATLLGSLVDDRLSDRGELDDELEAIFARLKQAFASNDSLQNVPMIRYGEMDMTGFSYRTGALFFALLRQAVGDEKLFTFIARYSSDHRRSGSRDAEFAAAMKVELGKPAERIVEHFFLTSHYVESILQADSWSQLREYYRYAD